MESTNTIILDDDFILPYSLDTMKFYEKLSKISRKNYDLEFSKTLNQNLIKELKALVSNSSLNEDVVLKSALIYSYYKQTGTLLETLNVSENIINNVKFLINSEKENNFDEIFNSDKKYLKTILLNNLVCVFNKENLTTLYKAKLIVNKYSKTIQTKLMKKLALLISNTSKD